MRTVLKQVVLAVALVALCAAILAATKAYGVWVITGIAGVLFVIGVLRREKPSGGASGDDPDTGGSPPKSDRNHE